MPNRSQTQAWAGMRDMIVCPRGRGLNVESHAGLAGEKKGI